MSNISLNKNSNFVKPTHNEANYGDFADTVLMPGDPLRSKLVAENFLERSKLVNNDRGVQGYTGYWKGKKVSVMASGMGQPAVNIYSYELFKYYDVKNIIRIGTCVSFSKKLHLSDILIAMASCTDASVTEQYKLPGLYAPIADWDLCKMAADIAEEKKYNYEVGNIIASDRFYCDPEENKQWASMGVKGADMESAALYCTAAHLNKRALTVCAVSNSFVYPEEVMSHKEREESLSNMIELSLDIAVKAYEL